MKIIVVQMLAILSWLQFLDNPTSDASLVIIAGESSETTPVSRKRHLLHSKSTPTPLCEYPLMNSFYYEWI